MKASSQISAWTDFTRTYDGYNYRFYAVSGEYGLPNDYSFNSDIIDYVIKTIGQTFAFDLSTQSGYYLFDFATSATSSLINSTYNLLSQAIRSVGNVIHDVVYSGNVSYTFDFSFTGLDEEYPGWDTYGNAYGFSFVGMLGEKIDLVLDSQGDFYGHNPIGNYTYDEDARFYENWILQNQLDRDTSTFWQPESIISNFHDLKVPYIEGKTLHFFMYISNVEHEIIIDNFVDTYICQISSGEWRFISPSHYCNFTTDLSLNVKPNTTDSLTLNTSFGAFSGFVQSAYISGFQFSNSQNNYNLPFWWGSYSQINNPNYNYFEN